MVLEVSCWGKGMQEVLVPQEHAHPGSHWKRRQCQRRQGGSINIGEVQFLELLPNQVQRLVYMMLRA